MLRRIVRALTKGDASAVSEPGTSTAEAIADGSRTRAALAEVLARVRPVYPPGFEGTTPQRWYDESPAVAALRAWIEGKRKVNPEFDAVGCLRDFADSVPDQAAPQIALALEYRALDDRANATAAMSAALGCNHWDLYTQELATEISAWAEGVENPNIQVAAELRGRFCSLPFEMLETSPNGDAYVCCPSWLPVPIGNIEQQEAAEIWQSPIAQELRRSILDGSFRYCSKMHCTMICNGWLPEASSPEARAWSERPEPLRTDGPRQVILSHDRSCNLACPSCRRDFILADKAEQAALDQVMTRFVMPILRGAESVKITGSGDPFGSNHFRRVLKGITREEFPDLAVDLHTNAQLWNERAWQDLGLASLVRNAEISIDAARPDTYAVVRRGGDFARLLDNLGFVQSLRQAGEIRFLVFSFVVQADNFREMPEFVELGERFGADLVSFNMIRNWGTYSREEFQHHFIGAKAHPQHEALVQLLRSPVFAQPNVAIGNVLGFGGPSLG